MTNTVEEKFDEIFDKIVPKSGMANTVIGEIFRAVARIGYRKYNDGDRFYEGYGCETCGSSATFLLDFPEYWKIITEMVWNDDYTYDDNVDRLYRQAVYDYEAGKYNEENHTDSRTIDSLYADDSEDEDDFGEDIEEDDFDEEWMEDDE